MNRLKIQGGKLYWINKTFQGISYYEFIDIPQQYSYYDPKKLPAYYYNFSLKDCFGLITNKRFVVFHEEEINALLEYLKIRVENE